MIGFKKHVPNFVESTEDVTWKKYLTLQELLDTEFVSGFARQYGFYRFSQSPHYEEEKTLMAEYKGGKEWWVVGFIKGEVDLPEWIPVKEIQ